MTFGEFLKESLNMSKLAFISDTDIDGHHFIALHPDNTKSTIGGLALPKSLRKDKSNPTNPLYPHNLSDNNVVGHLLLSTEVDTLGYYVPLSVFVTGDFRRQGIATALYKYAKSLGFKIKPSPVLTADGKKLKRSLLDRGIYDI